MMDVLSSFAFKFNLRRYTKSKWKQARINVMSVTKFMAAGRQELTLIHFFAQPETFCH
jgi:hypothetical protein